MSKRESKQPGGSILERLKPVTRPGKGALAECEWNFDETRVPDDELVACCYYEYARESPSIIAVLDVRKEMPPVTLVKRQDGGSFALPVRPSVSEWFNLPLRGELHQLPFLLAAHQTGKLTFAEPWQAKREADRRKVSEMLVDPPLHYEHKLPIQERAIIRPFNRATCLQTLGLWIPESQCERLDAGIGVERLRVQIDWNTFTDQEIVDSFKQWVGENRPTDPQTGQLIGRRSEKGHDLKGWRAMLERLGIMRLMHRHSFHEFQEITNTALSAKSAEQEKFSVKAECKKEREKALQDFHGLFPFLAKEDPQSCEPLPGTW